MRLVVIESPLSAETKEGHLMNRRYLLWVMRHVVVVEGNAAFASHALYPQFMDDSSELERTRGIECNLAIGSLSREAQFWVDDYPGRPALFTPGMKAGMAYWTKKRLRIRERQLKHVNADYWRDFLDGKWPPRTTGFADEAEVETRSGARLSPSRGSSR